MSELLPDSYHLLSVCIEFSSCKAQGQSGFCSYTLAIHLQHKGELDWKED